MTTIEKQDKIDDAVDFVIKIQNGIIAEVNQQNTVIKASSVGDIATFLGVNIKKYTIFKSWDFLKTINIEYPLLALVIAGLSLPDPKTIYYKKQRVLITVHGDVVLGVAPYGDYPVK